jgi:hypothetical protein
MGPESALASLRTPGSEYGSPLLFGVVTARRAPRRISAWLWRYPGLILVCRMNAHAVTTANRNALRTRTSDSLTGATLVEPQGHGDDTSSRQSEGFFRPDA